MAGFTYSSLKTAIQDYLDSSETTFVNNLDNFIKTTEERILKNVQLPVFRKNVSGTLTSDNTYLSTPDDYLSSFSLAVIDGSNKYSYLLLKQVSYIRDYTQQAATTGKPLYYAQFDEDSFIVAPTPDSNYNVELHYYYRPTSLTAGADSGTTWLSTNAPFALLFGSLVDAYIFMKGEPDLIQQYEKRFMDQLTRLKDYGEARENTDAYSEGLPRAQRT